MSLNIKANFQFICKPPTVQFMYSFKTLLCNVNVLYMYIHNIANIQSRTVIWMHK